MTDQYWAGSYWGGSYWGSSYWGKQAVVSVGGHVGGGSHFRVPVKKRFNPQLAKLLKEYLELKLHG